MRRVETNEIRAKRGLLIGFLVVASVVLARLGLSRGTPFLGLLIPGMLLVFQLFARPTMLFICILFLNTVNLMIPGFPQVISVSVAAQLLLIGWAVFDRVFRPEQRSFSYCRGTDVWLAVFMLNIFFIMAVRGAGFRLMGGSTYGGAAYVTLILTILFYFSAVRIRLSGRALKIALWAVFSGSLLYVVLEVLVYYFPGAFGGISRHVLFAYGERDEGRIVTREMTSVRWHSFRGLVFAALPIAYVWCRRTGPRLIIIAGAFILAGLTGFRSIIVQTGMMIFMASVYYSKRRGMALCFWILIGLAGLGFLIVASSILPLTVQRAVSFLPFIDVDPEMALAARQSTEFRIDMWRDYCIPNVPRYLLIGRGIAQDITEFAWLTSAWYGSGAFFYHMGSYHNGPFDLLLTYGLLGAISFTICFVSILIDGWRTVHRYAAHQNTFMARYFSYLTLWLTYEVISFYFIFGSITAHLFLFIAIAVQMRILKKNFLMGEPGAEVGDLPSEVSLTKTKPVNSRAAR